MALRLLSPAAAASRAKGNDPGYRNYYTRTANGGYQWHQDWYSGRKYRARMAATYGRLKARPNLARAVLGPKRSMADIVGMQSYFLDVYREANAAQTNKYEKYTPNGVQTSAKTD